MFSKKPTCKNITEYVNNKFGQPTFSRGKEYPPVNNISIYLPNLNENTFNALKANFKIVKHEFFGYIHFEK